MNEKLKKLREERKLSLNELSLLLRIPKSTLASYEAGTRVPRDAVKLQLSRFYGVGIEELFFNKGETL